MRGWRRSAGKGRRGGRARADGAGRLGAAGGAAAKRRGDLERVRGWRAAQTPGEFALVDRFVRDHRRHGRWARASRANGYFTADGLEALFEEYLALLQKYGHTKQDAPPGARPMQLPMFYIPEEPATPAGSAEEEPGSRGGDEGGGPPGGDERKAEKPGAPALAATGRAASPAEPARVTESDEGEPWG